MILFFDTETYCPTPIQHGTYRYAEDVEIMVGAWAVDDGPVIVEDYTPGGTHDGPSPELRRAIRDADEIVIHKSDFDRNVVREAWFEHQVTIPVEKIHDTMVRAMAHSLPGSLDKLCEIMGVPADLAKLKDGYALIQLFCKPRPKNVKIRRATRETHPVEWARFLEYAGSDILAMRALYRKLPKHNYHGRELDLWRLDQKINDRGFAVDVELAEAAVRAVRDEQKLIRAKVWEHTEGEVASPTKRDQVLEHLLSEYGIDLPDLKKDTLERRIADERLDEGARILLRLRLAATTSSTAKFAALLRSVNRDGRLRGTVQFCGAIRTGRWSGRLFQPQNMPRPAEWWSPDRIEEAIDACKAGCLDLLFDPMEALSNAMRGAIVASPGRQIVAADLSNIEGRVAAFLAGETWKLEAFAEIDAAKARGEKPADMYARAYAAAFHVTPEEVMADYKRGGFWRQVGKVMELALGYGGGVGAWIAFAMVYRLDLEAMAEKAWDLIDEDVREEAAGMLEWRRRKRMSTFGLSDRAFIVIESFKRLWRDGHPATRDIWGDLDKAAKRAVLSPGEDFYAGEGRLRLRRKGGWLYMILPSGRRLCYPSPEIDAKGSLSYLGVNQYSRKWGRIRTYGGKLFENACQAVARDVMAWNMPVIEAAGYEIVLTVHDEVITEAPIGDNLFTSKRLSAMLATNPPWLAGCPLAAGGFAAQRYRKD